WLLLFLLVLSTGVLFARPIHFSRASFSKNAANTNLKLLLRTGSLHSDTDTIHQCLSGIVISSGTLSPSFSSHRSRYTASVGNNVNTITVTPAAFDSTAVITVNGAIVLSGTASAAIPLHAGANQIIIAVTRTGDTTSRRYCITVTRA